jgi:hypothetical protein
MKLASLQFAVNSFLEIKAEFDDVGAQLGLPRLTCLVRQHHMDVDRGWAFFEVGLERVAAVELDAAADYVFWGMMEEDGAAKPKQVMVVLDPETIDSFEFEAYKPESSEA